MFLKGFSFQSIVWENSSETFSSSGSIGKSRGGTGVDLDESSKGKAESDLPLEKISSDCLMKLRGVWISLMNLNLDWLFFWNLKIDKVLFENGLMVFSGVENLDLLARVMFESREY